VTQDPPRMISVLSSTNGCVAFLRSAGPRGFTAYNADGQLIGLFHDKQAAVVPTTLAASDSDGGLGVEDTKRTEGAGAASSHSLPNSGARCLSCRGRQSPIIKKQASQLIAGVIASRKTGDQQQ
jgi:hypothetical protein